jgi:hypothetical protein
MRVNRLHHRQHRINEDADLIEIEPGSQAMLGELARRFVFERQRDIGEHGQFRAACRQQQCG